MNIIDKLNYKQIKQLKFKSKDKSKHYFEKFCSKEHGLKHLLIRSGFLAIFWIIIFIAVYCIMCKMIHNIILSYREYPLVTQIKLDGAQFDFPDVTICPKSPFEDVTDPNFQINLNSLLNNTKRKLEKASVKITKESLQSGILLQLLKYDEAYATKLYLHIIHCEYNGEVCSFFNFSEVVHPRYIKCFEFQPNKRKIRTGMGLNIIYYTSVLKDPFMLLNDLEDLNFFSKKENDGINVLVHKPLTFPSHEINYVPTSFSLRYGTQTTLAVTSLKYNSNFNYRKPCKENPPPFRYQNFRGENRFFEYNYTYENCMANKKQVYINTTCGCYSDTLFVPYLENVPQSVNNFCRYIVKKTSEQIRRNFFCHEIQVALSSTEVLDKYISPKDYLENKNDPDALKLLRLNVCSMACFKDIYETKLFQIDSLDNLKISARTFKYYYEKLKQSQFANPVFESLYNSNGSIDSTNIINFSIKSNSELIDVWTEERAMNIIGLLSEFGGIMGLCAGISFLMFIVLLTYLLLCFLSFFMYVIMSCMMTVLFKKQDSDESSSSPEESSDQSERSFRNEYSEMDNSPILPQIFIEQPVSTKSISNILSVEEFNDAELEALRTQLHDKNYRDIIADKIKLPEEDQWKDRIQNWK